MSPLFNALIAGRHQRMLLGRLWLAICVALLAVGYVFVVWQVASNVRRSQIAELNNLSEIHENVGSAIEKLQQQAVATPCSEEFLKQVQRVAFLPDGLNEFYYAPNNSVECSTTTEKFQPPVALGAPDIVGSTPTEPSLWIDRDLTGLGRPGSRGTIARLGKFAIAIPAYSRFRTGALWLKKEIVAIGANGQVWTIAGDHGLFRRLSPTVNPRAARSPGFIASKICDAQGIYCVASEANLGIWMQSWAAILTLLASLGAIFAWISAVNLRAAFNRHWSFESRFSRHVNEKSIVVAYQPILNLEAGEITGCEVLARWRDIDGTIVAPDRFINLIARTGRTFAFTKLVVDRAYDELHQNLPAGQRLQINFNVFACDLESVSLLKLLARFTDRESPLRAAIELVEAEEIDFDKAQLAIEELARAGVATFIDDFGTGYSSIERIATLAVHGVKLDRSFAMSPTESVLGRMLLHVLEMMRTSGHVTVVEGVETHARLELLRSTGYVDCVQGYVVARPLPIEEFAAFLAGYHERGKAMSVAA